MPNHNVQHRPLPAGFRRLDIPALNKQRWEALFGFLIRENTPEPATIYDALSAPKRTIYKLINAHNGFRIDENDYEWFSEFNPLAEHDFGVETNADDETLLWFRMKYL
jgi:hypothetical protein